MTPPSAAEESKEVVLGGGSPPIAKLKAPTHYVGPRECTRVRAPLKAKEADVKAVIDVTPINPFAHMQAEALKRYGVKKEPQH